MHTPIVIVVAAWIFSADDWWEASDILVQDVFFKPGGPCHNILVPGRNEHHPPALMPGEPHMEAGLRDSGELVLSGCLMDQTMHEAAKNP